MQVIMINSYWKKITWKIFMQIACACTTPGLRYQWSVIYFKTHRKNTIKCISSTIKSSYHAGYISGNSNPRYVLSRNTETRKKINSRTRETHGEFSVKWRSYDHIKANSYNWQWFFKKKKKDICGKKAEIGNEFFDFDSLEQVPNKTKPNNFL